MLTEQTPGRGAKSFRPPVAPAQPVDPLTFRLAKAAADALPPTPADKRAARAQARRERRNGHAAPTPAQVFGPPPPPTPPEPEPADPPSDRAGSEVIATEPVLSPLPDGAGNLHPYRRLVKQLLADGTERYACTHDGCTFTAERPDPVRVHHRVHARLDAPPAVMLQAWLRSHDWADGGVFAAHHLQSGGLSRTRFPTLAAIRAVLDELADGDGPIERIPPVGGQRTPRYRWRTDQPATVSVPTPQETPVPDPTPPAPPAAEAPLRIVPKTNGHPVAVTAPPPAALADLTLTQLAERIAALADVEAERDRWRVKALEAEAQLTRIRRAMDAAGLAFK